MAADNIHPDLQALASVAHRLAPDLDRVTIRTKDSKSVLLIYWQGGTPLQRATLVAGLKAYREDHKLTSEFLLVHVKETPFGSVPPAAPEGTGAEPTA